MNTGLVWLRRDLRLHDHPALYCAADNHDQLAIVYIEEEGLGHRQKAWLVRSLLALNKALNGKLIYRKGNPSTVLAELVKQTDARTLYFSRRYEPEHLLPDFPKIKTITFNSSLLIEPWDIATQQGGHFKVFTPFWARAKALISIPDPLPVPKLPKLLSLPSDPWPEAKDSLPGWEPGEKGAQHLLKLFAAKAHEYSAYRDFPAVNATSRLSPHLHFGEISPFQIWRAIDDPMYRSELGWREFSYHLLYHFPKLPTEPFDARFYRFPWKKNERQLKRWQEGKTGYPIVDAGMRELLATGWMHNRVRMIVASFLTKDLHIHWREGASWFWQQLVDADLANNSANWQWVAGCGADAAPYFRVFNPTLQGKRFDLQGAYIVKWCPEYANDPHALYDPIVDHAEARIEALNKFQAIKKDTYESCHSTRDVSY